MSENLGGTARQFDKRKEIRFFCFFLVLRLIIEVYFFSFERKLTTDILGEPSWYTFSVCPDFFWQVGRNFKQIIATNETAKLRGNTIMSINLLMNLSVERK